MTRALLFLVALTLPASTRAAECDEPYDVDGLLNDLGEAEGALRSLDYAKAIGASQAMAEGLPCLDAILPVVVAPRVMRAVGAGLYLGGDPDVALKWMRGAAALDPSFEYGSDLGDTHPVRRAWQTAKQEASREPVEAEGVVLGDGRHFVDGKRVNFPIATLDAYHLYQRDHQGVRSWVIDGNAFPDAATDAVVAVVEPPPVEPEPVVEERTPSRPLVQAAVVQRKQWPAERVVLVGGGGAALVGSGLLYALSSSSRSSFDQATTVEDLDRFKARTNTFAVSSGVTLAAGASALGFGALFFIIDGDPRPTLDIRF